MPQAKISGPQAGSKHSFFGCERPKNECFKCPTMGHGTRLGAFTSAGGGSSSIKKDYKGHSPEPPTLVVKCKETLSRDVTLLRSDAFKKISCGAGLFKMQRFETFAASCFRGRVLARHITSPWRSCSVRAHKTAMVCNVLTPVRWGLSA